MSMVTPKKIDTQLLLLVLGLLCFGIVMIYSASVVVGLLKFDDSHHFVKKQLLSAFVGIIVMIVSASIDYQVWRKWASSLFLVTFILLISVFFLSKGEVNGAHRWIVVGGQTFQPSELAKLTFILYASAWFAERKESIGDLRTTFFPFMGVLLAISVLMLMQPDFGTLSIMLVSVLAIFFVAGMNLQEMFLGLASMVVAVLFIAIKSPYRWARVMTFMDPATDTQGISYHIKNIALAIGSGGLWGLGFGESRQKRLFLPEPHTDSIFAIIAEELGYVRSLLIIAALLYLIFRCYKIATEVDDLFAKYVVVGVTSWFAYQTAINLGSMFHVVPLVGVPLPFVSYGGTNLAISLMAVGIVLNISRYRRTGESVTHRQHRRTSRQS